MNVPDRKAPRWLPIAYAAAAMLAILPIIGARHLPLLDAQGHESRLVVLRDTLLLHHPSQFYDFAGFFLPNVAFDVVGLPLVGMAGPELTGKLFFGLTLLLTLAGVSLLNRAATGRWSLAPLAATLLLYNLITILGFFSYAFGFALVLLALAGRACVPATQSVKMALYTAAAGVILLFCHVFDFGIYALMTVAFAAADLVGRRVTLVEAGIAAIGLLPAAALYAALASSAGGHFEFEPDFLRAKLFGMVKAVTSASLTGDLAFAVGAIAFGLLLICAQRVRLARGFAGGIVLLAVVYLALPDKMATGSYVDKRMPVAILLLFIAGLDLRIRKGWLSMALVGIVCVATFVKQGALTVLWRSFDPAIDTMARALDDLPAGAIILQAECEPASSSILAVYGERQPSLTHAPAMAAFADTRFVAATWAIAGQHTVAVRPDYRDAYDLQSSFGSSTCADAEYRSEYARIRDLAEQRRSGARPAAALFFLLIRPPHADPLAGQARVIAMSPLFTLYAVDDPGTQSQLQ